MSDDLRRAVLMNSGGVDSRLTAAFLHAQGWELVSLHLNFGLPNAARAAVAAARTAALFCSGEHVITFGGESLVAEHGPLGDPPAVFAVAPIALSVGASYARAHDLEYVALGLKAEQGPEFASAAHQMLARGVSRKELVLLHPFSGCLSYQCELELLVELTGSALELGDAVSCACERPCGVCVKCKQRQAAGIPENS